MVRKTFEQAHEDTEDPDVTDLNEALRTNQESMRYKAKTLGGVPKPGTLDAKV